MDANLLAVIGLIVVALVFDYINGFHDAANSIATVVSTRVLSPRQGGHLGGVLQLHRRVHLRHRGRQDRRLGPGRHLHRQLHGDLRRPDRRDRLGPDHLVLRAADELVARAHRRLRRGGGDQGRVGRDYRRRLDQDAHLHRARAAHRHDPRLSADDGDPVDLPQRLARRASITGSGGCSSCRPRPTASATAPTTRRRRWASSPARSSPAAISGSRTGTCRFPFWVVLAAHAAIALGTLSGGWRIIHTMGSKITKLQPVGGFAAETAGGDLALHRDPPRRPGQHDPHDHRRDHRRRLHPAPLGRALGRRRPHRLGLDPDDSRRGLIAAVTYWVTAAITVP